LRLAAKPDFSVLVVGLAAMPDEPQHIEKNSLVARIEEDLYSKADQRYRGNFSDIAQTVSMKILPR